MTAAGGAENTTMMAATKSPPVAREMSSLSRWLAQLVLGIGTVVKLVTVSGTMLGEMVEEVGWWGAS